MVKNGQNQRKILPYYVHVPVRENVGVGSIELLSGLQRVKDVRVQCVFQFAVFIPKITQIGKYIILNSVNKFSKHITKLRISIIPQLMAITGFLSCGFEIIFSKLSQIETSRTCLINTTQMAENY